MNSANNTAGNGDNVLSQTWFKYFPYWPLFVLLLFLSLDGTWFYLLYKTPLYESNANILIKDERKGLDDSKMIESLDQLSTKKIIENEMEVLHSWSLMNEVVKKLNLYAPVFEQGRLTPHSAYAFTPISIAVPNPDTIKGTGKIYFTFNKDAATVTIENNRYPLGQWVHTPYGMLQFNAANTENNITRFAKPMYFSLINPKIITQGLLGSFVIVPASKLSTVLNLKITNEVPERGEDILNTLILQYNKAAVNDKNLLAANTLVFVEDRLGHVAAELDSIERKIQVYKSKKGAIDINSQSNMYLQKVADNDQRIGDVKIKMEVLDQVEQYVLSKDGNSGIVPSTVGVTDPMLSQLLEKLNTLQLEHERVRKTMAENHALVVAITDQINTIKPSILENIRSQRMSLEASRSSFSGTNDMYSSLLQTIPEKEKELVEISREQISKNNIYTFLLQTREKLVLSNSSSVADSRIVDKAASLPAPVSPNKKLYYVIAVLLAFGLGVAILGANELFSRSILFRKDIENYTDTPIIAEIAFEKLESPMVIGGDENRFIAEQFRKFRASLIQKGIGEGGKRKRILVTSTIPGEGKSFIALNLALCLALTGKKVVLAEFDLSNPSLQEKLNQFHSKGVADFLKQEAEPEDIIKRTNVNENLFFVAAGQLPGNPSELIINNRASGLLSYLDNAFDYVIVDCAPAGPSSDAYILSPLCDLTLFVIRHKYTPKVLVQRMDENNTLSNLKNASIVFNGIRSRGFKKNNYGYGYGYGYEHNYYTKPNSPVKSSEMLS
jgi:tyrosine-protein kinase Etk/Wzc